MKWVHQQLVLGQCHEWFAPQQDDLLVELYTHLKCKLPYLMRCNKNYQYNNGDGERQLHDDYNTIVRSKKKHTRKKNYSSQIKKECKKNVLLIM